MTQLFVKGQLRSYIKSGYLSYLVAIMTVAVIPLHVQYIPPFIILWCIVWILENHSVINKISFSGKSYLLLFLLFITYYFWQAIGLIYTTDMKMGLLNLFGRLSLVLFPLVLFFPGDTIQSRTKTLLRVFAFSTFLFMLFCFAYALYRSVYLTNGQLTFNPNPPEAFWLSYFYSSSLTVSQHPSYIAMYVLISVFICFEAGFDGSIILSRRIWWLITGALLLITQYFLSSRAGILVSFILVPFYFIYKLRHIKQKKLVWIVISLVLVGLIPLIIKNQRVDYIYGRVFNKQVGYERKRDPRFLIWQSAVKIAGKNMLFGVGIGDVRTELAAEYARIGEENMAKERLNSHNQFLEVLVENGIIGLALFIAIFGLMIQIAIRERNLLYGMFIFMIFTFFMFETVLYRLAGVSFFSLFSFLLLYADSQKVKPD